MEHRASIPPGLPRPQPTTSYWQDPPDVISDLRTTALLPKDADIIIVGSGITGASVAYHLLVEQPQLSIVLLEAREAASGASGRNGGHTKGASYRTFLHNVRSVGEADAIRIARFEYDCMVQTHRFIQEHQIDCESRRLDTVDIIYDRDQWNEAQESVALMRHLMGDDDPAAKYEFCDAEETARRFLTPGAIGSLTYEAGSLSAYRLVIGILNLALARGLNLQCNTPATSVCRAYLRDQEAVWSVTTPRGVMNARKVILATNGYTAHLYPKLQGVIVPLRGFVTAQRPGKAMPAAGLSNTYSFIYSEGYEYMIPRPQETEFAGDIVIGGGLTKTIEEGLYEYGNTDDTEVNGDVIEYLKASTENFFGRHWGDDHPEGRIRKAWSGVMGFSGDGFPLIGPVPTEDGLYIAAAFQGHGMVNCFLCAMALAQMLTGREWDALDGWFPRAYRMSESRLAVKFLNKLNSRRTAKPGQPKNQMNGNGRGDESTAHIEGTAIVRQ